MESCLNKCDSKYGSSLTEQKRLLRPMNLLSNSPGKGFDIYNSKKNIGGIGRFYIVRRLLELNIKYDNVIFIDDDQILKNGLLHLNIY